MTNLEIINEALHRLRTAEFYRIVSGADEATARERTAELPRGQAEGSAVPSAGPLLAAWEPCDHRPPLPRIDTAPRYTPPPADTIPAHVREQIDNMHDLMRKREGERIWGITVDIAKGG